MPQQSIPPPPPGYGGKILYDAPDTTEEIAPDRRIRVDMVPVAPRPGEAPSQGGYGGFFDPAQAIASGDVFQPARVTAQKLDAGLRGGAASVMDTLGRADEQFKQFIGAKPYAPQP